MPKFARIQISPGLIKSLLWMPDSTSITGADFKDGTVELTVFDEGLPNFELKECELPPLLNPTVERYDDGTFGWDWGTGEDDGEPV